MPTDVSGAVAASGPVPADTAAPDRRGLSRAGSVLRVLVAVALATFTVWMAVTRRAQLARAADLLRDVHWGWLAVAAAAELVSFVTFVGVHRRLLRSGGVGVGLASLTGVALAGNAISNSLPGGEAFGRIYTFRQFRRRGADPVLAAWTMMAAGFLSGVALFLITATGAVFAGGQAATGQLLWTGVGLAAATVAIALLVRRTGVETTAVAAVSAVLGAWQRLARRPRTDTRRQAEEGWQRLQEMIPDRRAWGAAGGLALLSWVADCACLAAAFFAVGTSAPWPGLVLAYGASMLAGALPVTLGGLGMVEGSLAIGLVAYGGHRSPTVAAVVLYRALSFWILLPIGWTVWAVMTRSRVTPLVTPGAGGGPLGEPGGAEAAG